MKDENDYMKQLNDVKSDLYQIKVLLLILINVCLLGFCGISRSMWGSIIEVLILPVLLISLGAIIIWRRDYVSMSKRNPSDRQLLNNSRAMSPLNILKPHCVSLNDARGLKKRLTYFLKI